MAEQLQLFKHPLSSDGVIVRRSFCFICRLPSGSIWPTNSSSSAERKTRAAVETWLQRDTAVTLLRLWLPYHCVVSSTEHCYCCWEQLYPWRRQQQQQQHDHQHSVVCASARGRVDPQTLNILRWLCSVRPARTFPGAAVPLSRAEMDCCLYWRPC